VFDSVGLPRFFGPPFLEWLNVVKVCRSRTEAISNVVSAARATAGFFIPKFGIEGITMIPKKVTLKQVDEMLAVLGIDDKDQFTSVALYPQYVGISWDTYELDTHTIVSHSINLVSTREDKAHEN
jgi:hypothetical protein